MPLLPWKWRWNLSLYPEWLYSETMRQIHTYSVPCTLWPPNAGHFLYCACCCPDLPLLYFLSLRSLSTCSLSVPAFPCLWLSWLQEAVLLTQGSLQDRREAPPSNLPVEWVCEPPRSLTSWSREHWGPPVPHHSSPHFLGGLRFQLRRQHSSAFTPPRRPQPWCSQRPLPDQLFMLKPVSGAASGGSKLGWILSLANFFLKIMFYFYLIMREIGLLFILLAKYLAFLCYCPVLVLCSCSCWAVCLFLIDL